MSTAEAIIGEFERRLKLIQGGDFETNAGQLVFVGEAPTLGKDDPNEAIALIVGEEVPMWQGNKCYITLPLEAQILVGSGWRSVEKGVAAIKRVIEVDHDLGGLLNDQFPMKRVVVKRYLREPGTKAAGAGVAYELVYVEGWGQP